MKHTTLREQLVKLTKQYGSIFDQHTSVLGTLNRELKGFSTVGIDIGRGESTTAFALKCKGCGGFISIYPIGTVCSGRCLQCGCHAEVLGTAGIYMGDDQPRVGVTLDGGFPLSDR